MEHLFHKFPRASSAKLSRARQRCVCNPTLSAIATKKLKIHKEMFCDSVTLVKAMHPTAAMFDGMSFPEIADKIWKLDSPKALSDVTESILGAVFIDSGWR
jgi:endoribonuclease Dicer